MEETVRVGKVEVPREDKEAIRLKKTEEIFGDM